MNKVDFLRILDDERNVVGALMSLYAHQTEGEQNSKSTAAVNGLGFNMMDAPFLSSIAQFYENNGFITERQIAACKKSLSKYSGQFNKVKKMANKRPKQAKEKTVCSARIADGLIKIRTPYNQDIISAIKRIRGRRAKQDERGWYWTTPLTLDNVEAIDTLNITLAESLREWYNEKNKPFVFDPNFKISGLQHKPYDFQNEGVQFILSKGGKALIADDMGLGKTIQAIGFLQHQGKKAYPAVIVVPASVKINWQREIVKWMKNPKVEILSGRPSAEVQLPKADIYIVNYDILSNTDKTKEILQYGKTVKRKTTVPYTGWKDHLKPLNLKTIICDECHFLKNGKAKRSKAVALMAKGCDNIIMLSGTAIENRPIEIFQAIKMIDPSLFPSYAQFGKYYCNGTHNGFGWNYNGSSNELELHKKLTKTIMIRRLKKNVLKDLPLKQRTIIPMELSNIKEYKRCERDIVEFIKINGGIEAANRATNAEALVKFETLKQIAVKGKLKMSIKWIENFIEDEKLVVFCTHTHVVTELRGKFPDAVYIDGSVSQKNRQQAVDTFQQDPNCKLFIGNLKAAGVGITLTAASSTAFLELGWTPGGHDQAEDRVNRIGQTASSINAYYLLADNTVEIEIAELLDEKRKTIDAIMDGRETEDSELLVELMKRFAV